MNALKSFCLHEMHFIVFLVLNTYCIVYYTERGMLSINIYDKQSFKLNKQILKVYFLYTLNH